ncbi:MAG: DUF2232 domain-containing protein, partial [Beijerinckiaceae bacterium]
IGIGAGLVSALLTAVLISGQPLAIVLFFLAPLPIVIASLGWNHKAGLIATAAGSLALAVGFHPKAALVFALGTGLPGWWFSYLTLLARPSADGRTTEWYPPGMVLAWIAAIIGVMTVAGVMTLGSDYASYVKTFERAVDVIEQFNPNLFSNIPADRRGPQKAQLAELIANVAPAISAAFSVLVTALIMVIGGRVVMASGRLPRPWPWLPGMQLPGLALPVAAVAMALSLLDGFMGIAARAIAAAFIAAFALQGLAALHALSWGSAARGAILGTTYALCILFGGWPLIIVALIGVMEGFFNLRAKRGLLSRPPAPPV